jgi:hypothetical protein
VTTAADAAGGAASDEGTGAADAHAPDMDLEPVQPHSERRSLAFSAPGDLRRVWQPRYSLLAVTVLSATATWVRHFGGSTEDPLGDGDRVVRCGLKEWEREPPRWVLDAVTAHHPAS